MRYFLISSASGGVTSREVNYSKVMRAINHSNTVVITEGGPEYAGEDIRRFALTILKACEAIPVELDGGRYVLVAYPD